jgi:hypothetical protein
LADELFGLRAGDAVALAADDAVNALTVHHDVHGISYVTVG